MPARSPAIATQTAAGLVALGEQIRNRRRSLRINATIAAEAAGMSRVTWHRIEKGEPSVTIGAYASAAMVLGLEIGIRNALATKPDEREGWIPARVRLAEYPALKQLAWQVQGTDFLTPREALSIYERNWRHLDEQALQDHERKLIDALRSALGEHRGDP